MKLPPAFIAAVLALHAEGSLNEEACQVLGDPEKRQPAILQVRDVTRRVSDFLCANEVADLAAVRTATRHDLVRVLNGGHSAQYIQSAEFRAEVNRCGGGEAYGKLPERYRLSVDEQYVFDKTFRKSVEALVSNPHTQIQVVDFKLDLSTARLDLHVLAPFQHTLKKLYLAFGNVDNNTLLALGRFPHLAELVVYQTRLPPRFPTGDGLWPRLRNLQLSDTGLTDITSLGALTNLKFLALEFFHGLRNIEPIRHLTSLTELYLTDMDRLESIQPVEQFYALEKLGVSRCPQVNNLNVAQMFHLKELEMNGMQIIMRNEPAH